MQEWLEHLVLRNGDDGGLDAVLYVSATRGPGAGGSADGSAVRGAVRAAVAAELDRWPPGAGSPGAG